MRDQAILLVMLDTAFRVSELVSIDLEQYAGKHFRNVKRKGNHVTDRVFVGRAAPEALDQYIAEVRGDEPGPLFQSKRRRRLAPQNIADALGRIVALEARRARLTHEKPAPRLPGRAAQTISSENI